MPIRVQCPNPQCKAALDYRTTLKWSPFRIPLPVHPLSQPPRAFLAYVLGSRIPDNAVDAVESGILAASGVEWVGIDRSDMRRYDCDRCRKVPTED